MNIKLKKFSLPILILTLIVIFILYTFSSYNSSYKSLSNDKKNLVIVKYSTPASFGPSNITIKSKTLVFNKIFKTAEYSTEIFNDGKNLSDDNIIISWNDNHTAIIHLTGEEQDNEIIQIDFSSNISYKNIKTP